MEYESTNCYLFVLPYSHTEQPWIVLNKLGVDINVFFFSSQQTLKLYKYGTVLSGKNQSSLE